MEEVAGRGDPAVVRHEGTVWRPTGVVAGSERGSDGPDGGLPMLVDLIVPSSGIIT